MGTYNYWPEFDQILDEDIFSLVTILEALVGFEFYHKTFFSSIFSSGKVVLGNIFFSLSMKMCASSHRTFRFILPSFF